MNSVNKIIICIIIITITTPSASLAFEQQTIEINQNKNSFSTSNKSLEPSYCKESNKVASIFYPFAIRSLNNIIRPLTNEPLNLSDDDLDCLSYLSDCKIVGMGEATHGTKEFFQLKHRIFKYLVENYEFKIFAFEADMAESFYVDNFVTKNIGNIDNIMKNIMHFFTWRTQEVKDLLLWMRDYNKNLSEENKIHFIGVDCQLLTYQQKIITDYFNKTNITLSEIFLQFLEKIDHIGQDLIGHYTNMTIDEKVKIDEDADTLLSKFEDSKVEMISNSSKFEYQFIKQITKNIKKVNDVYFYFYHTPKKNINYRDSYMAENALWTSNLFDENTKVALWAHNGHVRNSISFDSMGRYLKKELRKKYQIIGFAFSQGSFTAKTFEDGSYNEIKTHFIKEEPIFGSLNHLFHNIKYDNFILREKDIPLISFFNLWLLKPRSFISIGAGFGSGIMYYGPIYLKFNYDILINWDNTSASEQLT
jgi:erythromycin esterase